MDLLAIKTALEKAGVEFARGLASSELRDAEREFGFTFPPDLAEFLSFALPVSKGWVDWRSGDREEIRGRMLWPYDGMCFDIAHNVFWPAGWGPRPPTLDEACGIAKRHVDAAPTLVPVYFHRYIPDDPSEAGHPILSVHQTDIIYYGLNLVDYLEREFPFAFGGEKQPVGEPERRIPLWSEIVDSGGYDWPDEGVEYESPEKT